MTQRLTLLQRRLIQLLQTEGLPRLAASARDAWLHGKFASFTYAVESGRDETVPHELRADFARANEQARPT